MPRPPPPRATAEGEAIRRGSDVRLGGQRDIRGEQWFNVQNHVTGQGPSKICAVGSGSLWVTRIDDITTDFLGSLFGKPLVITTRGRMHNAHACDRVARICSVANVQHNCYNVGHHASRVDEWSSLFTAICGACETGSHIVVHCIHGFHRSPFTAAVIHVAVTGSTFDSSCALVASRRRVDIQGFL